MSQRNAHIAYLLQGNSAFAPTFILTAVAVATRSTTGCYFVAGINKLTTVEIKIDPNLKAGANTFHQKSFRPISLLI
jgi:hypothetical protein